MSDPITNKPGEELRITTDQFNQAGFRICEVRVRWFGFENGPANEVHTEILTRINQLARELSRAKNT